MRTFLMSPWLVMLMVGCNNQMGIPQPEPIPLVDNIKTTSLPIDTIGDLDVVGLPGAVNREGTVTLHSSQETVNVPSTTDGTFAASLKAQDGELIEIRFESSDPAMIEVPRIGISAGNPPGPLDSNTPITVPVDGVTTIYGQSYANIPILVVNFSTGAIAQTTTSAIGIFNVTLSARSGDTIRIYNNNYDKLDIPWELVVP